jgi:hypothetical protein
MTREWPKLSSNTLPEKMKTLSLLLLSGYAIAAEPRTLTLQYKAGENDDYPAQIQSAFTKLLIEDRTLAADFSMMEDAPQPSAAGRYQASPIIVPIVISEGEHIDFGAAGGRKEFEKKIALYYRFEQGMHRGRETHSGFFALFTVSGKLTYGDSADSASDLTQSVVTAAFQGFSRTLKAPSPSDVERQAEAKRGILDHPTATPESKPETNDNTKPQPEVPSK